MCASIIGLKPSGVLWLNISGTAPSCRRVSSKRKLAVIHAAVNSSKHLMTHPHDLSTSDLASLLITGTFSSVNSPFVIMSSKYRV